MKIHDILAEDDSGDYQQMQAFVRANRTGGVPADQQVALALFRELKRQQAQNQALGSELSHAEQRIDQAMKSGELSRQELGMHRTELDRERAAGERQKGAVSQLGQQYAERERASREQMDHLTDQLAQIKTQPGVNRKDAEALERQIKELGEKSVPLDRLADLESSIAAIQDMQTVDDSAIKDIIAQINAAEQATKDIAKNKQQATQDAERVAQAALDQVEQMRQDLERLDQVAGRMSSVVTDALPAKLDSIAARVAELDSESEHQYDELLKHDQLLTKLTGRGGGGVPQQPTPPVQPRPTPPAPPAPPSPGRIAADAIARAQKKKLAQAQGLQIHQLDDLPDDVLAESVIRWATGKTK